MLLRQLWYFQKVMKQQWLSEKRLDELQRKSLRGIIKHAYRYVPYYRRKWKEIGITPDDIKELDDLRKLPTLTKKEVLKNYNDFIAINYKHLYDTGNIIKRFTSGTTGEPLGMIFDFDTWNFIEALYLRILLSVGYNPRKELAFCWYEPFERNIYNRFGFLNKIYIPSFLNENKQLEILEQKNPEYYYFFATSMFFIAKKVLHEGIKLNPKLIVTHSEILTKNMRKIIEKAFDAPVYDRYGTHEFFSLAWECRKREGFHINSDGAVMELLSNGENVSSGELGNIVVTGFKNYMFPLIRYGVDDFGIGTDERCSCGRVFPLLKSIEGRKGKLVRLKFGKVFTQKNIKDALSGINGIYKHSIKYENNNKFEIGYVPFDNSKNIPDEIKQKLEMLFKEEIKIKFKLSENIEKSKRGKYD